MFAVNCTLVYILYFFVMCTQIYVYIYLYICMYMCACMCIYLTVNAAHSPPPPFFASSDCDYCEYCIAC